MILPCEYSIEKMISYSPFEGLELLQEANFPYDQTLWLSFLLKQTEFILKNKIIFRDIQFHYKKDNQKLKHDEKQKKLSWFN